MKWPLDLFASIRRNQSSRPFIPQLVIGPAALRSALHTLLDSQLEWVTNTSIWTLSQAIKQSMLTFSPCFCVPSLDFALEIKLKTIVKVRG